MFTNFLAIVAINTLISYSFKSFNLYLVFNYIKGVPQEMSMHGYFVSRGDRESVNWGKECKVKLIIMCHFIKQANSNLFRSYYEKEKLGIAISKISI